MQRKIIVVLLIVTILFGAGNIVSASAGECPNCESWNTIDFCDSSLYSMNLYNHNIVWLFFTEKCVFEWYKYKTESFCDDCGYQWWDGSSIHDEKVYHRSPHCDDYGWTLLCNY